jgi:stage V sporulation protein R
MFDDGTNLSPELQGIADSIADAARGGGLDFFTTIFQMVDYKQLNEIAAYGGFPTRYPHWRYAMDYERLSKGYTYGLSTIYEMVINTDPCYAYLLRANNLVYQKTVIAHVYAHCDFFKNNYWFSKTNRKMLDQMANHASFVRRLIEDIGHDEVESFIDNCLSLENLIDIHAPFRPAPKPAEVSEAHRPKPVPKIKSKKYMDSYVNPKDFLDSQRKRMDDEAQRVKGFPDRPERDVLKFLLDYAPLNGWQKRLLEVIRDESYYFAPQGQTKIMNEGWATYWHSQLMTKLAPLHESEIIDYCDHYAGVVFARPGQINPYKMGVQLFRFIEERWNRGRFGIEYSRCDDPRVRAQWGKGENTGLGKSKIFEVRSIHNDVTFIDEFLDEDFCHEHKLFIYDFDKRTNKYVISSRDFREVKARFLQQLTNFGQPVISVVDGNFGNRGELLLRHQHDGVDLHSDYATETLKSLFRVWQRPVHIETVLENTAKRISFDGNKPTMEKTQP